MFNDRKCGRLLLSVRVRSLSGPKRWLPVLLGILAIGEAGEAMTRRHDFLVPAAAAVALLAGALMIPLRHILRFYEAGVVLPPPPADRLRRLLPWNRIERHYWDGDRLCLVCRNLTGSGELESSVNLVVPPAGTQEFSFGVPAARRQEIDGLLTQRLSGRSPAGA